LPPIRVVRRLRLSPISSSISTPRSRRPRDCRRQGQAGETRTAFTNNHLQYAITWYGLAAALLAVFAAFVWRRLKEPQAERLTQDGRHP
jgi:cytochrome oxidase assembly protein ShyY1